jgi:hypothetical protein
MRKKIVFALLTFFIYGLLTTDYGLSDTIYTKDNKEIKGIIVEEYKDRVLMSTVDGERSLMKSDIKELYFDTEEQNLIKLAEQARDRGDFIKAFVYYDKAFKISPDSKAAKDGIVFLQGYLFKKDIAKKESDIQRRNDFEERGAGPIVMKTDEERFKENTEKLRKNYGISLKMKDSDVQVSDVGVGSPAYEAGMRSGDMLVAVWGRFVRYLSLQEVVETLLEKTSLETKCSVERDLNVNTENFGAGFKMLFEGMTVSEIKDGSSAQEAGLKTGDIITAINGKSTRYMPLNKALDMIKMSKDNNVTLALRRDVVIWGKEGG